MKISRIGFGKDWRQFPKGFELNLTYPAGHHQAGKPLDKVCFIGQSGTGKTSLLEEIERFLHRLLTEVFEKLYYADGSANYDVVEDLKKNLNHHVSIDFQFEYREKEWAFGKGKRERPLLCESLHAYIYEHHKLFISLKTQLRGVQKLGNTFENPANELIIKTDQDIARGKSYGKEIIREYQDKKYVDSSMFEEPSFWWYALNLLNEYDDEAAERFEASLREANTTNAEAVFKDFLKWKNTNPNPRKKIAEECLNPILNHFYLQVDEEWSKGMFKLQSVKGEELPLEAASTGTKQILLSALPIHLLDTQDTIILFDEPETSLYPDIQAMLVEHYTQNLAPTSQFFFATHSPIIAGSFEPWEIIELKFDDNGMVYQEQYFEGKRHIDNYHIDPRYYTYGMVLSHIFDLKQHGGNSSVRDKARSAALYLRDRMKELNKEGKREEAEELFKEYETLMQKLNWTIPPTS